MKKSKFLTKRGLPFALMKFAESKRGTNNVNNLTLADPPVFSTNTFLLHDLDAGTSAGQRIGETIQQSGYYIKLFCQSIDSNVTSWVRCIVYSPRDDQDTDLPTDDLRDIPDPNRFIVWSDKSVSVAGQPGGGSGIITIKKKFKPYRLGRYSDSSGTNVTKGSLYMLLVTNNSTAVEVLGVARLYFKDV